jgi:hypothetical protein
MESCNASEIMVSEIVTLRTFPKVEKFSSIPHEIDIFFNTTL